MPELVAVRTSLDILAPDLIGNLKRDCIFVNRISIPNIALTFQTYSAPAEHKEILQELNWLFDKEIVFEPPDVVDMGFALLGKGFSREILELLQIQKEISGKSIINDDTESRNTAVKLINYQVAEARLSANYLREAEGLEACLWSPFLPDEGRSGSSGKVIGIVLKNLPVPSQQTPWEQILEYRGDPDSKSKFLALRDWTTKVAKSNLSNREIEDNLEYLLDQYSRHLDLHKMKTTRSTLETVVVTTAELLENLITIKWSKAASLLFSIRKRKIELMEAESSSPGREVAFIRKAQMTFRNTI